jgi:hypothetical protein
MQAMSYFDLCSSKLFRTMTVDYIVLYYRSVDTYTVPFGNFVPFLMRKFKEIIDYNLHVVLFVSIYFY